MVAEGKKKTFNNMLTASWKPKQTDAQECSAEDPAKQHLCTALVLPISRADQSIGPAGQICPSTASFLELPESNKISMSS